MLDILLSIRHDSDLLFEARKHMPGNHRAFLNEFQRMYKVKIADLTSSDLTTLKGYTACVLLLTEFRKKHRDAAVEKAVAVAYKAAKGKGLRRSFGLARHRTRTEPIGAGGSEIVPFLSKLITDTLDSKKGRIMKL
ncbi:hypothetical protein M433DRAFT_138477 [Acidomyces richmondensis BFW]|nr:hypothetical protein M433DRAFT_138477 [Acidomyces richmondensis BFW]